MQAAGFRLALVRALAPGPDWHSLLPHVLCLFPNQERLSLLASVPLALAASTMA